MSDVSTICELIHLDVWGPYTTSTLTGTNYMLTIVDDKGRATWTYLLHHKSQVTNIFSSFVKMVDTQFERKVKCIRTDNGGEFMGHDFQNLLNSCGITHQRTAPYTPQQNGAVERKHRQLLQLARFLMIEASMLEKFWPYSLLMATHIVNRLPSPILNWKTPYEMLYKKELDYTSLKVFGCLGYATNNSPHKR